MRPPLARMYEFMSSETTPGGTHRTRLVFRVTPTRGGGETATVLSYENADGGAPLAAVPLAPPCADSMRTPQGALAEFAVTPPPADLSRLVAACAPEDLWGAVSDILPVFMIQSQSQFRARELRHVGERLRFRGYDTRWGIPPTRLDQRITADSGAITLDSLNDTLAVLTWDTSPMRVGLLRRLPTGGKAMLQGREWFAVRARVDRRTGDLLSANTVTDSLRLRMQMGYTADTLPGTLSDSTGMLVRAQRRLQLRMMPGGQ